MNNPPSEIEHLQHLVSNLRRDLQNALMQSRRRGEVIEKCKVALMPFECETCTGRKVFQFECEGCLTGEGECTCSRQPFEPCPQCQRIEDVKAIYQNRDDALTAIEALEKEGLSK